MIFAMRTFGAKMTQGFGGLFAGFGLAIIGFPDRADCGDPSTPQSSTACSS